MYDRVNVDSTINMTKTRDPWMSAAAAAQLLGVTRPTLYAYVSRGYVRSQAVAGSPKERSYAREDVERLRRRTEERRAPDKAAARALQWGLPILESSITFIDGRRLFYRGHDAAILARTRSLEDVATLIWTGNAERLQDVPAVQRTGINRKLSFVARAQSLLATAGDSDPQALDLRAPAVAATGLRILQVLKSAAVNADRAGQGVDAALAGHWNIGAGGRALVRAALVLCADHELNVSSFTARCVASAGAHPYAVVIAALSALEGPRHGGASARVEAMLTSFRRAGPVRGAVTARFARGETIDGFGHPLYPHGDPRARLLLELLGERYAGSAEYRFVMEVAREGTRVTGEHPNVDFGLAAVSRVLKLPPGSPLVLFAIGRSAGWIGQAIEQYATGQLIRPRARYVGLPPVAPARE
jgi:citrate synthase